MSVVPGTGVEPACPFGQIILSDPCMPFHHPGMLGPWCGKVTPSRARDMLPTRLRAAIPTSRGVATSGVLGVGVPWPTRRLVPSAGGC